MAANWEHYKYFLIKKENVLKVENETTFIALPIYTFISVFVATMLRFTYDKIINQAKIYQLDL